MLLWTTPCSLFIMIHNIPSSKQSLCIVVQSIIFTFFHMLAGWTSHLLQCSHDPQELLCLAAAAESGRGQSSSSLWHCRPPHQVCLAPLHLRPDPVFIKHVINSKLEKSDINYWNCSIWFLKIEYVIGLWRLMITCFLKKGLDVLVRCCTTLWCLWDVYWMIWIIQVCLS